MTTPRSYTTLENLIRNGLVLHFKPPDGGDTDCPCCREPYSEDVTEGIIKTSCGHTFHLKCLLAWLRVKNQQTCPMCRFRLIQPSRIQRLRMTSTADIFLRICEIVIVITTLFEAISFAGPVFSVEIITSIPPYYVDMWWWLLLILQVGLVCFWFVPALWPAVRYEDWEGGTVDEEDEEDEISDDEDQDENSPAPI